MINIAVCAPNDAAELARMNRILIEDEHADNNMSLPQLEHRMKAFLTGDYKAFYFNSDGNRVGYALVNLNVTPPYLRQFFICREHRRLGNGKSSFHALLDFLQVSEIDIDVYSWNHAGIAFWESLGFSVRCYNMRFKK